MVASGNTDNVVSQTLPPPPPTAAAASPGPVRWEIGKTAATALCWPVLQWHATIDVATFLLPRFPVTYPLGGLTFAGRLADSAGGGQ